MMTTMPTATSSRSAMPTPNVVASERRREQTGHVLGASG